MNDYIIQYAIEILEDGYIIVPDDGQNNEWLYNHNGFEYKDLFNCIIPENACYQKLFLDDKSSFEEIKNKLIWGTRGKTGKDKKIFVKLCNCELEHLESILKKQLQISEIYIKVIKALTIDKRNEIRRNKIKSLYE